MSETQIFEQLTAIFRDVLDNDAIVLSRELSAPDVPEWDSFNHVNIVVASEMKFGVKFTAGELESLRNVGDFVGLILQKQNR